MKSIYGKVTVLLERTRVHNIKPFNFYINVGIFFKGEKEEKKTQAKIKKH